MSRQTVSNVLNSPDIVRPDTRGRVERAIADLGYRVNTAARALVTRSTRTVGVVGVSTAEFGPTSALHELEAAARAAGLSATVVTRVDAHRGAIEAAGARVVPFALGTSRINPMAAGYEAGQLAGILKALEADLLHAIGLRAIVVGGTAAAMSGIAARIAPRACGRWLSGRGGFPVMSRMTRSPCINA